MCMSTCVCQSQEKLHTECGLRPTEIVVGGSLGHGTALPWKFDADIVIYSEGMHMCTYTTLEHIHIVRYARCIHESLTQLMVT